MTIGLTRREVIGASAAGGVASLAGPAPAVYAAPQTKLAPAVIDTARDIVLHVNGRQVALHIEPRVSLLDALRDYAGLTGTKKGCDRGSCGACTVHLDGVRMNACLLLAVRCEGRAITTIEGLAQGDTLHPMQAAFIAHDAFQCGYCTPGQIMAATALVHEGHAGSPDEIREWMTGNICRCGAYNNIVAAVAEVAGAPKAG